MQVFPSEVDGVEQSKLVIVCVSMKGKCERVSTAAEAASNIFDPSKKLTSVFGQKLTSVFGQADERFFGEADKRFRGKSARKHDK